MWERGERVLVGLQEGVTLGYKRQLPSITPPLPGAGSPDNGGVTGLQGVTVLQGVTGLQGVT